MNLKKLKSGLSHKAIMKAVIMTLLTKDHKHKSLNFQKTIKIYPKIINFKIKTLNKIK